MQRHAGLLFCLPLLVAAGLAGFNLGGADVARDASELALESDPTRAVVLGGAYLIAFVLCLSRFGEWRRLALRQVVLYLFLAYMLTSFLWSVYPLKVIVDWGHYVGYTLVATAAALHLVNYPQRAPMLLGLCAAVAVAASIAVSIGMPSVGIDPITGRWQGLSGNPNSLGLLCALLAWCATSGWFLYRSAAPRTLSIAALALALWGLTGAGSTTSMVIAAAAAIALPLLLWVGAGAPAARTWKMISLVAVAVIAAVALYSFLPGILHVDTALASVGRDTTLTGRVELWQFGFEVFESRPYLGWSFDSLASVFARSDFSYGQFHNGYLDLAVRGGIVGLTLALVLVARVVFLLVGSSALGYSVRMAWAAVILVILLHNLTEASLFRTTHIFTLVFLLAYCVLELARASRMSHSREVQDATRPLAAARAAALSHLLR